MEPTIMRRFIASCFALAVIAYSTLAAAEFVTFDKSRFEALVEAHAPVVVHTHEWW